MLVLRLIVIVILFTPMGSVAQKLQSSDNLKKTAGKILRQHVLTEAAWAMKQDPVTVTAHQSARSTGGKHDFYSEGDYWWPNPANIDSPYIQKDGLTNPGNFTAHRKAMIRFSRIVGALASAYILTGYKKYALQAMRHCNAWFVDPSTLMNPHLLFAQAIKGRATGRGIGIIDTIHFLEIVQALMIFQKFHAIEARQVEPVRSWFMKYTDWLMTHPYGKDEMNALNNHGTCWVMQVAEFSKFTGNREIMNFCRDRYMHVLLPGQMATNGSFPLELKRTKPYGYSIFNLDAMAMICQILGDTLTGDLWIYEAPGGQSISKGIEYLFPYIKNKAEWPFNPDVMYWKEWPVAQPFLLLGAIRFSNNEWFKVWETLDHSPTNEEVIRNLPVRNPLIWIENIP